MTTGIQFSYDNNDGAYIYKIGGNIGALYKFRSKNDRNDELNNKLFFLANYNLNRSEGQDFNNKWFLHLRYNKEIPNFPSKDIRIRLEGFLQTQKNDLLSINERSVLGAGIRLKLVEDMEGKNSFHLYIGSAYMYEIEHTNSLNLDTYNHRNSSYLTANFDFGEDKLQLVNTIYYQPLFQDFQNYRLAEEFSAEMPLSHSLSFKTTFTYFLNNKTPLGDAEFTSHIGLGFTYDFKKKPIIPETKMPPLWLGR
ncbi:MAG: DUF481 domain-containing protein [Flavobacteriaceae bacterium]|nr:DUF481 domain-containing protein [Flavobacteriaceae bacterium]